jgi:hypothetical protein
LRGVRRKSISHRDTVHLLATISPRWSCWSGRDLGRHPRWRGGRIRRRSPRRPRRSARGRARARLRRRSRWRMGGARCFSRGAIYSRYPLTSGELDRRCCGRNCADAAGPGASFERRRVGSCWWSIPAPTADDGRLSTIVTARSNTLSAESPAKRARRNSGLDGVHHRQRSI